MTVACDPRGALYAELSCTSNRTFVFHFKRRMDLAHLGQPDGISPSRMAEMLEVDKAGQKVRC